MALLARLGARLFVGAEVLSALLALGGFDGCSGERTGVYCGGIECPANPCYSGWYCGPENDCRATNYAEGWDDNNACTKDVCVDGDWKHEPIDQSTLDDGDSCTVDECNPVFGITHVNTCG